MLTLDDDDNCYEVFEGAKDELGGLDEDEGGGGGGGELDVCV